LDFYKKLYRVLKTNGKLFHYIGEGNQDLAEDVIKRLKAVGFKYVKEQPDILGVIAQK
jgi:uncharacterized protein